MPSPLETSGGNVSSDCSARELIPALRKSLSALARRVQRIKHRSGKQDRRAALFCGLVNDVHGAKLQRCGMIGIGGCRFHEFGSVFSLRRAENNAVLFFALGLRLS